MGGISRKRDVPCLQTIPLEDPSLASLFCLDRWASWEDSDAFAFLRSLILPACCLNFSRSG